MDIVGCIFVCALVLTAATVFALCLLDEVREWKRHR
jgi:hypothetical protein